MTPPPPTPRRTANPAAQGIDYDSMRRPRRTANGGRVAIEDGAADVQGPLVRQPAPAARLARILHHSAQELWDVCTETDAAQMYEDARAIASRILAACPSD